MGSRRVKKKSDLGGRREGGKVIWEGGGKAKNPTTWEEWVGTDSGEGRMPWQW